MKRKIMGLMVILAMAVACQKNESFPLEADTTLYATMEEVASTRTMLDDNNNVLWSESDQIVAFMKTSLGLKYQVTPESVGKTAARFTKISTGNPDDLYAGSELSHNVAYYPYSDIVNCMRSGENYEMSVILPTEQTYTANSFGNGSLPMVAVSEDNKITFRNVCGGMKLQLKGTQKVTSIKLEGKNGEKLSGAAKVTAYTDETKLAITMAPGASTSVSLNCGTGVQLNENTATEFIIALPPVLFSKGFTVTVTDAENKRHKVETDKVNNVLRSSLLNMPVIMLETSSNEDSDDGVENDVPVSTVQINETSLTLATMISYTLIARITPADATDQSVVWNSDNPSVVSVDHTGVITTISDGSANVTATAGGVTGSCTITVKKCAVPTKDYIDENGVNHGKGIAIGDVIWAPVNCGFEPDTEGSKGYEYGKLYQWGRKYGQGYSSSYDETIPELLDGPASIDEAQTIAYSNIFIKSSGTSEDWVSQTNQGLWNSGTEDSPVKTGYDPCPTGWRVPTYAELNTLVTNHSSKEYTINSRKGYYFSGEYTYLNCAPSVFLPAAGCRYGNGSANNRDNIGYYWTSRPMGKASRLIKFGEGDVKWLTGSRSNAYSVRCVQE